MKPKDRRNRRTEDQSPFRAFLCDVARIAGLFWDFTEKRKIGQHAMAWSVFGVTVYITFWLLEYIWQHSEKPGLDIGAVISAIMLPWSAIQGFVIKWYISLAMLQGGQSGQT